MSRKPGGLFLPLDVEFMEDDKVIDAGEKAGWLYLAMCLRSKRLMSDGMLTDRQVERLPVKAQGPRLADLVRVQLVQRVEGGYLVLAFTKRNSLAADITEKAEKKAAGAALGNHNRWHAGRGVSDPRCSHCTESVERLATESVCESTETETETETERETERERTTAAVAAPTRSDVEGLCRYFAAALARNDVKATVTAKWRTDARLMLDKDEREPSEIRAIIDWATSNDFWRPNILSVPKLREKYDQLRLQMRAGRRALPEDDNREYLREWS